MSRRAPRFTRVRRLPRTLPLALVATFLAILPSGDASTTTARPLDQAPRLERHYQLHVGRDLPLGGGIGPVTALAVGLDGSLYAADETLRRVLRFNGDGTLTGAWGGPGGDVGEFGDGCARSAVDDFIICGASDLAIGPDGDVYAADPFNGRVQRFKPWGAFVSMLCVFGPDAVDPARCASDGLPPSASWGVAVGPDGRVYVSEADLGKILVFAADGQRIAEWSVAANDIAIGPAGEVVAAVPGQAAVVVLGADGQELERLGTLRDRYQEGPEYFSGCGGESSPRGPIGRVYPCNNPRGVAVGPDGAIYAATTKDVGAIRRFLDGKAAFFGLEPGLEAYPPPEELKQQELMGARRVAVGRDGTVYVADARIGIAVLESGGRRMGTHELTLPRPPVDAPQGDAAFVAPEAIAPAGDGVVVLDTGRARLQWLAPDGSLARAASPAAPGGQTLVKPVAIAAVPGDGFVVADAATGLVHHVDAQGALGRSSGEPARPVGPPFIAFSLLSMGDGTFLAAEFSRRRVVHVADDGTFVRPWATEAFPWQTGDPNTYERIDLARAPDGDIIALDVAARRVVRLRFDGMVVGSWPLGDAVQSPRAVEVATNGDVLVLDMVPPRIVRFDAEGNPLGAFGAGILEKPVGLAVLPDGGIVVACDRLRAVEPSWLHWFDAAGNHLEVRELIDRAGRRPAPREVEALPNGHLLIGAGHWYQTPRLWAMELDREGTAVREWTLPESGRYGGHYAAANDVAPAGDGGLWVTGFVPGFGQGYGAYRLSPNGEVVRGWRSLDHGEGSLAEPSGVAVAPGPDGRNRVFVADAAADRIVRFAWDGAFEADWRIGADGASLDGPRHLVAARDGTLWATDPGNARVVHFDWEGRVLGDVAGNAEEPGRLVEPVAVAIAPDGGLRVLDAALKRVWSSAADGSGIVTWAGDGPPGTRLVQPTGLAFASDGTLWVTDRARDRAVAFGVSPPTGWRVQLYRDGALIDGPVAVIRMLKLDLDWNGAPPLPGMAATGFSLRAEGQVGDGPARRDLVLTTRGGATMAAPHGAPPVIVGGDPGQARVSRVLAAGRDWLRIDYGASGVRQPMVQLAGETNPGLFFPAALNE